MGKTKKKRNLPPAQSGAPQGSSPSSSGSSTISPLSISEREPDPTEPGRLSETEFPRLSRKEVPPDKKGGEKLPDLTPDPQDPSSPRDRPTFMSPEGRRIPAVDSNVSDQTRTISNDPEESSGWIAQKKRNPR